MSIVPKLFIAIDQNDINKAKELIQKLAPEMCGIKVGKELFTACGPEIIQWIQEKGFKVFLDLKYHDIPNTVEKACFVASKMGVSILNVHALGGIDMMLAAKEGVDKSNNNPYLIAVTLLTSMDSNGLKDIGFTSTVNKQILNLAKIASQAKMDGIVCSAKDIINIKSELPESFLYVTPGIRLSSSTKDDQKRISTPLEAVKMGSNILVIGRPITQAKNPEAVLNEIMNEIS
jgi:orotidine-5'-phosphate decarboxylase|tara:strand:+ start:132 stop:827 length:696 start_codon:yes stop_codon:yes gene_type:complete